MSNTLCAYTDKSSYFPNERVILFINNPYTLTSTDPNFLQNYSKNGNVSIVKNNGNVVLSSSQTTSTPGIKFQNIKTNTFTLEIEYDTESEVSLYFVGKNFRRWRQDDLPIGENQNFKKTFTFNESENNIKFYLLFSKASKTNSKSITIKSANLLTDSNLYLEIYDIKKNKILNQVISAKKEIMKKNPATSSCDWVPSAYITISQLISGLYFIKILTTNEEEEEEEEEELTLLQDYLPFKNYSKNGNDVSIVKNNGNIVLSTYRMIGTPGIRFQNIKTNTFTLEIEYDTESEVSLFFIGKNFRRWRQDDLPIGENQIFKKKFTYDENENDIVFYLLFSRVSKTNFKSITIKSIKMFKETIKKIKRNDSFYLPLIVKNEKHDNDLLVLSNTNTWNAYNSWNGNNGSASFYRLRSSSINSRYINYYRSKGHSVNRLTTHRANVVINNEIRAWMDKDPYTHKTWSHLLYNETLMYLFLLDNSINYDLICDYDMHTLNIEKSKNYKMILLHGHPEYWSENALINLNKLAQNGTNIGYFGGNGIYWKSEFLNNHLLECRKDANNFRFEYDLKNGGYWINGDDRKYELENKNYLSNPEITGLWFNRRKATSTVFENFITIKDHFILEGVDNEFGRDALTSYTDADGEGISGWEVDDIKYTSQFSKYRIATAKNGGDILYIPKGSESNRQNFNTFSAGTILWNYGLLTDEGISKLTLNVINHFTKSVSPSISISVDDANSDNNFINLANQNVNVNTGENNTIGFTVSKINASLTEANNTDTFTVILNAQPNSDVVLNVISSDTNQFIVNPTSLTFTSDNWDTTQIVTIISIGDFTLSKTTATVAEAGGTDTFTLVLTSQPESDVVLNVTSENTNEVTVSPDTLTFTPTNWNNDQTVTVTGVNDNSAEQGPTTNVTISIDDNSSAINYQNIASQSVTVTATNDDTAGFTLSGTTATVAEAGGTDTFTVVLTSQPESDVVLNVTSENTNEITVSPDALTFTPTNWNTNQTVTVTGIDDNSAEQGQTTNVTIFVDDNSSATSYQNVTSQSVTVNATNDDTAGFILSETTALLDEVAGDTDTFTVILTSQPESDVVLNVTSENTSEVTVSPSELTFTPTNWNTNQTVTVTGVDNNAEQGQTTTVTISIDDGSSATSYQNVASQTVTASIV